MMTDTGEDDATAEQTSYSISMQSNNKFINSVASIGLSNVSKKLSEGLMSIYQKPLVHIKQELSDLTVKQEACMTQMQLENKKLCDVQEDIELNDLFSTIETYQNKLFSIKKEIMTIHERAFKLKKKAVRFQQSKQKEALHKEIQSVQELQREEQTIGRPESS